MGSPWDGSPLALTEVNVRHAPALDLPWAGVEWGW